MKTLNSEQELLSFLESVSKKSVIDASKKLFEQDSYVDNFSRKLSKEIDELELLEQDEEEVEVEVEDEEVEAEDEEVEAEDEEVEVEDPEGEPEEEPEGEPVEEPEGEPEPDTPKKPKVNPAAEKALSLPGYEKDQDVQFDQILTAINLVRAGNSTKSKKTKGEIEDYFDKLDKEEKAVLAIYLKELAKIMTGAIDGDEAHDPSDPTTYFDIIVKSDSGKKEEPQVSKDLEATRDQTPAGEVQPQPKQMAGEEDVTPPIRVNEQQSYRGLKKIRG